MQSWKEKEVYSLHSAGMKSNKKNTENKVKNAGKITCHILKGMRNSQKLSFPLMVLNMIWQIVILGSVLLGKYLAYKAHLLTLEILFPSWACERCSISFEVQRNHLQRTRLHTISLVFKTLICSAVRKTQLLKHFNMI